MGDITKSTANISSRVIQIRIYHTHRAYSVVGATPTIDQISAWSTSIIEKVVVRGALYTLRLCLAVVTIIDQ